MNGNISHVNALPAELLSQIFDLTVERRQFGEFFYPVAINLSSNNPPLCLTQVSSRWRAVALNTVSLWDSICSTNRLSAIQHWLAVSPKIHYRVYFDPSNDYVDQAFRSLSQSSSRWKALGIYHHSTSQIADDLVKLLRGDQILPIKHLWLRVGRILSDECLAEILPLLSVLPLLERLEFENIFHPCGIPDLPWSRLNFICAIICSCSWEEIITFLSSCTSATEVKFDVIHVLSFEHDRRGSPRHRLPLLTSLTLARNPDPIPLLAYFDFPSLQHLKISVRQRDLTLLEEFVARTPGLERFFLYDLNQETLGDGSTRASDVDILSTLSSPILRRIPQVKIVFPNMLTRTLTIIKKNPSSFRHSLLICWNRGEAKRRYIDVSVGWRDVLREDVEIIWVFREGEFQIAPERLDEIQRLLADDSESE